MPGGGVTSRRGEVQARDSNTRNQRLRTREAQDEFGPIRSALKDQRAENSLGNGKALT
jgi:hypothetical protein